MCCSYGSSLVFEKKNEYENGHPDFGELGDRFVL